MGKVERWTGKPRVVEMMLWDGTDEAAKAIAEWVGRFPGHVQTPLFEVDEVWDSARLWNTEEHCWVNCPIGHRVAKGRLGEFYPISPAALEAGYLPQGEGNGEDPRPA